MIDTMATSQNWKKKIKERNPTPNPFFFQFKRNLVHDQETCAGIRYKCVSIFHNRHLMCPGPDKKWWYKGVPNTSTFGGHRPSLIGHQPRNYSHLGHYKDRIIVVSCSLSGFLFSGMKLISSFSQSSRSLKRSSRMF
jgi:hypothetical protein